MPHDEIVGRKTKFTAAVAERIVSAIRAGNYARVAAEGAGIHRDTFYDWLKRGDTGEKPFSDVSDAVARASADAEMRAVGLIAKAMDEDWRAALEYLKRRHPDRWQDRAKYELKTKLDLSKLSDHELAVLKDIVHKAQPQ
jgi:hypothetical protein